MSPPIDRADEERLVRIFSRMLDERLKPVAARVEKHSGKFVEVREEISPAVAKKFSESQHDSEDARTGFERMMMGVVGRLEDKVDTITRSIAPAANAAKGAEDAAVAAGRAAVSAEGTTKAVQVAADNADTQSLAAKKWAKWGSLVALLGTVAQIIQYLLTHFG